MKKITCIIMALLLMAVFSLSTGCSRQPSDKRSVSVIKGYFKKYSKKYPETILGQYPVENIMLLHTEEIHKGMVVVYAILELGGNIGMQTRFTLQKKPLGWRALSWENMGVASRKPVE